MIAYKLFKLSKQGVLHPLYVSVKQEIPLGVHLDAKPGEKTAKGKVKSALGELAYRPGWHLTEIPFADHIGKRQPNGELYQKHNNVWCEVEFDDMIDYTEQAAAVSPQKREQYLEEIPVNGYYWCTTNAAAKVRWLISGGIKVLRIMTNDEVAEVCRAHGLEPQPVDPGPTRTSKKGSNKA